MSNLVLIRIMILNMWKFLTGQMEKLGAWCRHSVNSASSSANTGLCGIDTRCWMACGAHLRPTSLHVCIDRGWAAHENVEDVTERYSSVQTIITCTNSIMTDWQCIRLGRQLKFSGVYVVRELLASEWGPCLWLFGKWSLMKLCTGNHDTNVQN